MRPPPTPGGMVIGAAGKGTGLSRCGGMPQAT